MVRGKEDDFGEHVVGFSRLFWHVWEPIDDGSRVLRFQVHRKSFVPYY